MTYTFDPSLSPVKRDKSNEIKVVDLQEYKRTGKLPVPEKSDFEKSVDEYLKLMGGELEEASPFSTKAVAVISSKPKGPIQRELEVIEKFQQEILLLQEDFDERVQALSNPTTGSFTKTAVWRLLKETSSKISAARKAIESHRNAIKALAKNGII